MRLKHLGAGFLVVLLSVVALPSAASAATISLTAVSGNLYQQTVQNPCIFTNPSCQQPAGFNSTALPVGGAVNGYDAFVSYTAGQLNTLLAGGSLQLGLDINQASGQPAQTLSLFTMAIGGVVTDTFSFGGAGNVPAGNNGNGYADYLLSNFTSIAGLPANTVIQFHFVFNNANDGTENVFLISGPGTPTPVPEPATMLLLGTGLLAAARARRKKVA